MIVVLSNQLEELLEDLREELTAYLRANPLGDAWVIVPSSTMKEYIRAFLIETMGIAAGVRFAFLSELVPLPSKLSLSLTIEQKIQADLKERKKIIALSDALADQFLLSLQEGKRPKEEWINSLFRNLYSIEKKEERVAKLFLFGFSHIPSLYWEKIESFQAALYHLSPCRYFWSDLLTDRQRFRELDKVKEEVKEELDAYFTEGNALLRNFGALPRLFARTIEEKELLTRERYAVAQGATVLAKLQNDLLDMEQTQSSIDDSLTLHAASTPLREVAVLYRLLVDTFREEPSLLPSEVRVYVTDLHQYAPLISFVFGEKQQRIPYAVIGAKETSLEESLEAFLFLLSFAKGEWSIEEIEELLGFSPILARFGIRKEERETVLHWLRKAGARFGFAEGETSWQGALDRLLRGLAFEEEEHGGAREEVGFTEAELLGRLILLLTSLSTDLLPIREGEEREYRHWLSYLRSLALGYLPEGEEREKVEAALAALEENAPLYGGKFSFLSMERVVNSLRQRGKRGGLRALLGSVCFFPLEQGALVPAKRIFVLGCDEESLPKAEARAPFSSFSLHKEEQRALFLELLLSAREKLAFMYSRLTKEGEERRYSPFFTDLFEVTGEIPFTQHPLHSFDPPLGLEEDFLLAGQRGAEKEKEAFFTPRSSGERKGKELSLSLTTLSRFARHPLRHYLREGMQLGLQGDPMEEYLRFEFSLPPYVKQELRRKGVGANWDEFVEDSLERGKLPSGGIRKGILSQLRREVGEEKQALLACGIDPKELFSLTLSEEYRGEKMTVPLTVPLPEGRIAKITGILPDLSPKGLVLSGKGDVSDWIKQWPLILVYTALVQKEGELPPSLLFSAEAEVRSLPPSNYALQWLADYLLFYERALENPSLFLPDWGKFFLEEKGEEFAKKVKSGPGAGLGYEDIDWEWVRQKGGFSDPRLLFAAQQAELETLFSDPYRFWKGELV